MDVWAGPFMIVVAEFGRNPASLGHHNRIVTYAFRIERVSEKKQRRTSASAVDEAIRGEGLWHVRKPPALLTPNGYRYQAIGDMGLAALLGRVILHGSFSTPHCAGWTTGAMWSIVDT
jgi:hypothetical protein